MLQEEFAPSPVLKKDLRITFSLAFMSAPFSIRALTISVWPFMAAQIRAVLSFCETNIRHDVSAGLALIEKTVVIGFLRVTFY
jgi:hypothetical protein